MTWATDQNLDGMIQDLLDAAKFQSEEQLQLRLEEFDMQELAKEVCGQFTFAHFQLVGHSAKV